MLGVLAIKIKEHNMDTQTKTTAQALTASDMLYPYYTTKGTPEEVISVTADKHGVSTYSGGPLVPAVAVVVKYADGSGTHLYRFAATANVTVSA